MTEHAVSLHRLVKPSLLASSSRRVLKVRPTPENPLIVSASELGSFLRCRVQHHWGYQCGLAPRAKRVPLAMGTLGHMILDRFYSLPRLQRTEKRMATIARKLVAGTSMKELETKDKDLLIAMTVGYVPWTMNPQTEHGDYNIGLREAAAEEWFDLPLTKDGCIRVRGRLDTRFTPHSFKKSMAILESKFKGQIRMNETENKIQLSVYLWALRVKYPGFKRYLAYYQVLRKQMPGPRVKADLFARALIERDADEVDQWALDTERTAWDMLDGAVYPNPMDSCDYACDFKVPCLMRGNASDLKYTLRDNFQPRVKT